MSDYNAKTAALVALGAGLAATIGLPFARHESVSAAAIALDVIIVLLVVVGLAASRRRRARRIAEMEARHARNRERLHG